MSFPFQLLLILRFQTRNLKNKENSNYEKVNETMRSNSNSVISHLRPNDHLMKISIIF